jgi:hypothetical protein
MKRPENIIDNGEYNEPNCFESDQEAVLFYAYLEQEKYIDELEKQLTLTDVVVPKGTLVCGNCETKLKAQYHTPKGIFCKKCKG